MEPLDNPIKKQSDEDQTNENTDGGSLRKYAKVIQPLNPNIKPDEEATTQLAQQNTSSETKATSPTPLQRPNTTNIYPEPVDRSPSNTSIDPTSVDYPATVNTNKRPIIVLVLGLLFVVHGIYLLYMRGTYGTIQPSVILFFDIVQVVFGIWIMLLSDLARKGLMIVSVIGLLLLAKSTFDTMTLQNKYSSELEQHSTAIKEFQKQNGIQPREDLTNPNPLKETADKWESTFTSSYVRSSIGAALYLSSIIILTRPSITKRFR